jgi:membrane-bound metal-dependent hydrolase YbcI (DUF457 family)
LHGSFLHILADIFTGFYLRVCYYRSTNKFIWQV